MHKQADVIEGTLRPSYTSLITISQASTLHLVSRSALLGVNPTAVIKSAVFS